MTVAMDAMAVAIHIKYALSLKRHITFYSQRYSLGQWVYYFNPRKIQGRQDKWRRKFQGPFLIVKIIGTVNVMLQRSKRS